jgi:hypothetical protein
MLLATVRLHWLTMPCVACMLRHHKALSSGMCRLAMRQLLVRSPMSCVHRSGDCASLQAQSLDATLELVFMRGSKNNNLKPKPNATNSNSTLQPQSLLQRVKAALTVVRAFSSNSDQSYIKTTLLYEPQHDACNTSPIAAQIESFFAASNDLQSPLRLHTTDSDPTHVRDALRTLGWTEQQMQDLDQAIDICWALWNDNTTKAASLLAVEPSV